MEKLTMNVEDICCVMGISRPKAYELVKSEGFPSFNVGRRIIIPVAQFEEWLANQKR